MQVMIITRGISTRSTVNDDLSTMVDRQRSIAVSFISVLIAPENSELTRDVFSLCTVARPRQ